MVGPFGKPKGSSVKELTEGHTKSGTCGFIRCRIRSLKASGVKPPVLVVGRGGGSSSTPPLSPIGDAIKLRGIPKTRATNHAPKGG
jgi:hypothetical protein